MTSLAEKNMPVRAVPLALMSGVMLTGAFPKIGLAWLAWLAMVPLLMALRDLSRRQGFVIGLAAGLAHHLTMLYWLSHTMKTYGQLPGYLCVTVLVLFSLYLSVFPALFSAGLIGLAKTPLSCLVVIPLLWVGLDYIRSFLFTGFPWEFIGYSQYDHPSLIQIADLFGVYGVSFWIAAVNALVFVFLLYFLKTGWQGHPVTAKLVGGACAVLILMSAAILWYGDWRIRCIDRMMAASDTVTVGVVQGNIDQIEKWDPAFQMRTIDTYLALSHSAKPFEPDLLVWPETAMPFYFHQDRLLTKIVQAGIRRIGTDVLVGSPFYGQRHDTTAYYNSVFLVDADGIVTGRYDKAHLVPFGEYIPFHRWFPFLGKMVAQVGDFTPGEKGRTLAWGTRRLGVQICYEIIFPSLSRAAVKNGADLIINVTNDAWYGDSSAPYQHFSMTVFRAVENRRMLIRAANTGISGFVDPAGRIRATTPLFVADVLIHPVAMIDRCTLYTRMGDVFALACLIAVLGAVVRGRVTRSGETD